MVDFVKSTGTPISLYFKFNKASVTRTLMDLDLSMLYYVALTF